MQKITDILTPISDTLGLTFIRSDNLSEANIDMHYDDNGNDLMIYNGQSKITTNFEGHLAVDNVECEIYFLRLKPEMDQKGEDLDGEYAAIRKIANSAYFDIQDSADVYNDPLTFELEPTEVGTDMYIGYMMKIIIAVINDGC